MRVLAKLIYTRLRDQPVDLDQLLESLGVEMSWRDKLELIQNLEGVDAIYHAVWGKILLKKKY
ncbi:MAG: hypothetical protein ACK4M3_07505 [Pyrobaculum sp.]